MGESLSNETTWVIATWTLRKPSCLAITGGIYDFSGTQPNHVYAEKGQSCSKEEVMTWVPAWWDGASDGWSSDEDFNNLLKQAASGNGYSPFINGDQYIAMKRNGFGDGDCQHVVCLKDKTKGSKKGACIAHSDYTLVCAVFDEDKKRPQGPCLMACQALMEAYKEAGY